MLNVKGEKVDFSSDYLFLLQDYGFGFAVPENWRSEYEGLFPMPENGILIFRWHPLLSMW